MAILSNSDMVGGLCSVDVDHDPALVATDVCQGSLIFSTNTKCWYEKQSDGANTDVKRLAAGAYTATQVISVAKYGSDSNDGLSAASPKLTIGAAVAAINPNSTTPWRVEILDGGVYTENIVAKSYGHLHGPAATLQGTLTVPANCRVYLDSVIANNGTVNAAVFLEYSNRSYVKLRYCEAYGTSGAYYCVRALLSNTNRAAIDIAVCVNNNVSTSAAVIFNDYQGDLVARIDVIECECRVFWQDDTLGNARLFLGYVVLGSSFPLGSAAFDWVGVLHVEVGYIDLNSRAYLVVNSTAYPITGNFGKVDGFNSSYSITVKNNLLGLANIKVAEAAVASADVAAVQTALGNGRYFRSGADTDYVYLTFCLPIGALGFRTVAEYIIDTDETTPMISLKTDYGADNEPYAQHNSANTAYSSGAPGAHHANDRVFHEITAFFSSLQGGDRAIVGMAKGKNASSTYYYLGGLTLYYFGQSVAI